MNFCPFFPVLSLLDFLKHDGLESLWGDSGRFNWLKMEGLSKDLCLSFVIQKAAEPFSGPQCLN